MGSTHATSSSTRHSVGNLPSHPARQMEASFALCLILLSLQSIYCDSSTSQYARLMSW